MVHTASRGITGLLALKHGAALLIRQEALCTKVNLLCVDGGVGGETGATWSGAGLNRDVYSLFGGVLMFRVLHMNSQEHYLKLVSMTVGSYKGL